MTRSIFGKLLVSHFVVILLTVLINGLFMSYLLRSHVIESKRRDLVAKGNATVEMLNGRRPNDTSLSFLSELIGANAWIMLQDGTVVAGKQPEFWSKKMYADPDMFAKAFEGTSQSWIGSRRQANPAIVVTTPLVYNSQPAALFLSAPIIGVNKNAEAAEKLLLYSLTFGLLASLILGYFISRSLTRPLADISQAAQRFSQGHFDSRTKAVGTDEIGRLGTTFNHMADSLSHIDQNRREFLANVTHELKTPITCIQAFSETLLDGLATTPEQQKHYLNTIVTESKRIDRLIHELLDLAQLDAGELSISKQKIDLMSFLHEEKDKYAPLLKDKSLTVILDIPRNLPETIADPDRLAQVIANLISNAVRYAPENSDITISAQAFSQHLQISVSDNGIGIAPKDLPLIWDRFYRVDKARTKTTGGSGIGLAITKRLVETMGGTVSVESEPNVKTVFSFTLPIA